ncbi:MAG: DUF4190 domain-containing protein [Actinobacteria bacterium]|nr:hypothetical protein [Microbacterium sp.]RUA25761.1 MAG: DUF4190 domain-containing protein [Actinomycetota bacterium]HIE92643.1 DUF4190 domain-containing protein [Acidobacteriota bacterium]RCL88566.1 MAG: DUF4190 domain-containing protein [Microbacterium sp.]HAJ17799.1 hypothetical protein [Microbacterium sp.]
MKHLLRSIRPAARAGPTQTTVHVDTPRGYWNAGGSTNDRADACQKGRTVSDQNTPAAPEEQPPAAAPAPPASYPPPAPPAPPAYGAPAAPPAYGAAPAYTAYPQGPKTNTLAIVSLVSSLVGVFVIPVIGQIVGIITGHMSLSQIKQTGEGGRGLGLAGVIIGWVTLGLAILGIILFIAWFGVIFANAREMGYSS